MAAALFGWANKLSYRAWLYTHRLEEKLRSVLE